MSYLIISVLLMAGATIFTRAFPFLLFARKKPPQRLLQGAKLIPGAVMTILVFTSLPVSRLIGGSFTPDTWAPWAAAMATALLHLGFRQPLVSIFGGTALYMGLIHLL